MPYRLNLKRNLPFMRKRVDSLTFFERTRLAFLAFKYYDKLPHRLIMGVEADSQYPIGDIYVVSMDENGRVARLPLTISPRFTYEELFKDKEITC